MLVIYSKMIKLKLLMNKLGDILSLKKLILYTGVNIRELNP